MKSVRATADEQTRSLPGDTLLPETPTPSITHAITIRCPPHDVWRWLAKMGAGSRAGWYSYDFLDHWHHHSAGRVAPELQHLTNGMVFRRFRARGTAMERKQLLGIAKRAESGAVS